MDAPFRVYRCRTCGETYDEALGCPEFDIPPGTRFEDLPADFICPACGTSLADFELYA